MLSQLAYIQVVSAILIALVLLAACTGPNNGGDEYKMSNQNKLIEPDGRSCEIGLRIYHSCDSTKWKDFCIEEAKDLFISQYYDKTKCTALIGLPFLNRMEQFSQQIIVEALVSRCNYNIVLLDNSKHTRVYPWKYLEAIDNSYEDAKLFATALNQAMDDGRLRQDCMVGVGYSLAANTMGHVCRMLKHPCQAIYAIDPAGPGFLLPGPDVWPSRQLVSQQDACHVVFLLCTMGHLGTKYHMGHVNILLNDGENQPNCNFGLLTDRIPLIKYYCAHRHCNKVFANALASPGSCVARQYEILGKSHARASRDLPGYRLDLAPDMRFFKCAIRKPDLFFLYTLPDATCNQNP